MRRLTNILLCICLLLTWFNLFPLTAAKAATPTPTPTESSTVLPTPQPTLEETPEAFNPADVVSFTDLGATNILMHGPYDSFRLRFTPPIDWRIKPGAKIQLNLSAFFSNVNDQQVAANGGTLNVTYNGNLIASIILDWTGQRLVTIPIPDEQLVSNREDGRHELFLFLNAAVDCNLDHKTTVEVEASSRFILPHDLIEPTADLRLLPQPFYQDSPIAAITTTVIVADQASAGEIQAALTVIAGLSRLTSGNLKPALLTVNQIDPITQSSNHLIYVGKASGWQGLAALKLPAPVVEDHFSAIGSQPGDGLIQLAVSTWNTARMVLVVGGNNDEGVIKAAQAISSGLLRTGNELNLAIVSDVQSSIVTPIVAEDRTLSDLGYEDITQSGFGLQYAEFRFYIPPGKTTNDEAYFNLIYSHSAILDYARSGMVVYLNDRILGSVRFSDLSTQPTSLSLKIPAYMLRPGINRLMLVSDIVPLNYCSDLVLSNLWVNISPDSLLHIPLLQATDVQGVLQDLKAYPYPFISSPSLKTLAFVTPAADASAWSAAARIAAELGASSNGALTELAAAFGDAVSEEIRQNCDLIIVGRASQLPIVNEMAGALPAPFDPGSDMANESSFQVTFRLPPGVNLGYIQLLYSPWKAERTILAVTGSTPDGLIFAAQGLTESKLRNKLTGNFAVIHNTQVLTADTRFGLGTGNLSATAIPGIQPTTEPFQPSDARPVWLLPGIITSSVLTVLILLFVAIKALRRKS